MFMSKMGNDKKVCIAHDQAVSKDFVAESWSAFLYYIRKILSVSSQLFSIHLRSDQ